MTWVWKGQGTITANQSAVHNHRGAETETAVPSLGRPILHRYIFILYTCSSTHYAALLVSLILPFVNCHITNLWHHRLLCIMIIMTKLQFINNLIISQICDFVSHSLWTILKWQCYLWTGITNSPKFPTPNITVSSLVYAWWLRFCSIWLWKLLFFKAISTILFLIINCNYRCALLVNSNSG